jgi:hypothetical protein
VLPYHKSVLDWMGNKQQAEMLWVEADTGHALAGSACARLLMGVEVDTWAQLPTAPQVGRDDARASSLQGQDGPNTGSIQQAAAAAQGAGGSGPTLAATGTWQADDQNLTSGLDGSGSACRAYSLRHAVHHLSRTQGGVQQLKEMLLHFGFWQHVYASGAPGL